MAVCVLSALGLATGWTGPAGAEVVTRWIMPDIPLPEAERPQWPNVAGTVALPVRPRSTSTRWSKVMRASLDQPRLEALVGQARGMSPEQQAGFVQAAVNRAARANGVSFDCSDDGYWAPAGETLARGMGDCFDIAVAKMEALRSLGIPTRDLYLTTGYFRDASASGGQEGTAALLVRIGDEFWLLSEQSDQIIGCGRADDLPTRFTPYVTYGVGMTWIHGRMMRATAPEVALARAATPLAASAPAGPDGNRMAVIARQLENGGRRKD